MGALLQDVQEDLLAPVVDGLLQLIILMVVSCQITQGADLQAQQFFALQVEPILEIWAAIQDEPFQEVAAIEIDGCS